MVEGKCYQEVSEMFSLREHNGRDVERFYVTDSHFSGTHLFVCFLVFITKHNVPISEVINPLLIKTIQSIKG